MRSSKNLIIVALLIVILAMAVGYTAFATQISVNGTAEIIGVWDVGVSKVEAKYISPGCNAGDIQFTNTTVKFDAQLVKPSDYITYAITIKNAGTINAVLEEISFSSNEESGSPAILCNNSDIPNQLNAGEQVVLLVQVMYDENVTEVPEIKTKEITGIIEYVQEK